jgi:ketosteroid isomerase-like protein
MSASRFAVLMLALFACAKSTTDNPSGAPSAVTSESDQAGQHELGQLEDQWAKAVEAHDSTFLARIVAPHFHGTGDSAKTFDRASVLRDAVDTTVQMRNLRDQDRQVRIYGDGTVGVVTANPSWTIERGQRPGEYSGRYTETWVKRGGQWQIVAGHYTTLAPPDSAP